MDPSLLTTTVFLLSVLLVKYQDDLFLDVGKLFGERYYREVFFYTLTLSYTLMFSYWTPVAVSVVSSMFQVYFLMEMFVKWDALPQWQQHQDKLWVKRIALGLGVALLRGIFEMMPFSELYFYYFCLLFANMGCASLAAVAAYQIWNIRRQYTARLRAIRADAAQSEQQIVNHSQNFEVFKETDCARVLNKDILQYLGTFVLSGQHIFRNCIWFSDLLYFKMDANFGNIPVDLFLERESSSSKFFKVRVIYENHLLLHEGAACRYQKDSRNGNEGYFGRLRFRHPEMARLNDFVFA